MSYSAAAFTSGVAPSAIVIDGATNVWLIGDSSLYVVELPAANYAAANTYTVPGSSDDVLSSLGVDAAGNVWVTNLVSSSVNELIGVAKPVVTPLQNCLAFETANPGHPCVP